MSKVKVGDPAPAFSLCSQDGEEVKLSDLLEKGNVVVYFYPKDKTPGCTAEAGAFRDSYPKFEELGAQVVGISSDSVESHQGFASDCNLPFKLLSDPGGQVRKLFGVSSSMGLMPGRVTYVMDRTGKVRHIFSSQMNPKKHVDEAVAVLKSIRDQEARAGV